MTILCNGVPDKGITFIICIYSKLVENMLTELY